MILIALWTLEKKQTKLSSMKKLVNFACLNSHKFKSFPKNVWYENHMIVKKNDM